MAVELNNTTANHWSETDGSNTASPPDGAPAGMFPNQSEPVWRGIMGTVKRAWDRSNGSLTVGGTANAITLTPANTAYPTAYVTGELYQFKATAANTAATTININTLGAKNLYKKGISGVIALTGGEIQVGDNVLVSYDGTQFQLLSLTSQISLTAPQFTYLKSGTGTYSTPAGALYLKIRMVGGGGGGGASGATSGSGGSSGGNTTFGSQLVANGGALGTTNGITGGVGGSASLGTITTGIAIAGGYGGSVDISSATSSMGGNGGNSPFGGSGCGSGTNAPSSGTAAAVNSGSGGGGGGNATSGFNGAGGGSGGYIEALIASPSSSYLYAIGVAGSAQSTTGGGFSGGAGGSGLIVIEAHFQ